MYEIWIVWCCALERSGIHYILCVSVGRLGLAWTGLGQVDAKVPYKFQSKTPD
jgi:hypothetical protein